MNGEQHCGCGQEHDDRAKGTAPLGIGTGNTYEPFEAEILDCSYMTPAVKRFRLRRKDRKPFAYKPGQFLEVSLFGYGEIPIGLASSPTREDSFEIVIRQVGRVSTALNLKEKGDSLYLRGPLGQGFPLCELRDQNVLIVAGGIGLCPTRSLIQYILDRRREFKTFTLFFGARSVQDLLFREDLAKWRASDKLRYLETVDQPDPSWQGNVGVITTLFKKTEITRDTRVVICGPPIMYKFVMRDLDKLGIAGEQVYMDLERRMKCGIGKCGHCQINDKYVCADGPVFSYAELRRMEEAF